jgi:nucleoid-associated protein YgaU
MGLWSFVKGAGKKLMGGDDEAPTADDLKKEVADLGLEAEGLELEVEGDKVRIAGVGAASPSMREKIILAVGNVTGIGAVETAAEADDGPEPVFHTVEKGDTLWAISTKTLGNGARYEEIFEANKPMLSHPDKIYPGQMLCIPQDDASA